MQVVSPSFDIMSMPDGEDVLKHIEAAGRTCYKSEDKITPDSAAKFVKMILKSGHESVVEHASATVRFICDRGVTHELVRHRIAAYSQESTRYANYSKDKFGNEITVIRPVFWKEGTPEYERWKRAMQATEAAYLDMIANGARPEEARSVLPNSLKTEIVMTANLREWRHVFRLRCSGPAHPQIREIMLPLLDEFARRMPALFEDLREQFAPAIEKFKPLVES
ncbi:FAD-dependent thymidylate synthase [Desulfovibrio ferrophilus]|uniref:FAD-dependent thymidylate synthase n=1 Tax=Desulfovibrio ferrophilus TaxID=241368 RepID=A0A2Z6AUQ2_9BACT|nr:FAD-dependent thymidylate synthase [Desulfovibrio ferrophilus]BBD06964.1 thymidylate synthase, flavin-dependent [Desulfovibrio ferrophilus]